MPYIGDSVVLPRLRDLSARAILTIGWLGLVIYAFPGHMSFDSIAQLLETRSGVYSNAHPPAMAALWRLTEMVVAGPLGMLVIQTLCFVIGCYLLFRRRMSDRWAAVVTTLLLWFPVVSNTMSTIWKDSQMTAFLVLGLALILSDRRRIRILGCLSFVLATAMRHNALAMTFPLVLVLFVWTPGYRWWRRYAISLAAWVAITGCAQLLTKVLTDHERFLWHESIALLDIVGTMRHLDDMPDEKIRELLAGTQIIPEDHLHEAMRRVKDPAWSPVDILWDATDSFFIRPTTAEQRAGVTHAWRAVVPAHLSAYLAYRWTVFRQLIQLSDGPFGSAAYVWFTDIQDLPRTAGWINHNAWPSRTQQILNEGMWKLGFTPLFRVYIYLFLALALLPFCIRDREAFAVLASGLTSEAALFILTPTTDFRYSFWLVFATVVGAILLVARRAKLDRVRDS